jgi:hypothetical protein
MPGMNRFSQPRQNGVSGRLSLLLLPFVGFICVGANAQSPCSGAPVQVDETVARLHIAKFPIEFQDNSELRQISGAKMSSGPGIRMSQMSVLQVDVDGKGHTTAVKAISGLHEYSNLFSDMLKRVSYVPFKEGGEPVCVQNVYKVGAPPEEVPGWGRFRSLIQRCADLSRSGAGASELISTCQSATEVGDQLPASYVGMDKRLAYVTTATALMRDNRAKDALTYAQKAVETADLGFDNVSGKAAAYGVRGQARGLTGDLKGANEDLMKAEELERATFEVPRKPEQKIFDRHALQSMLGFHAEILTALGRKSEADKLRDEARKL